MRWAISAASVALAASLAATALAQSIAFSFDDGFDPRREPEAARWNAKILAALDHAGIQAALFPAGRIVDTPEGLALVKAWGAAGHAIGNHTYSHRNLNSPRVSLDEFLADVARGDALFRDLPHFRPRLRFPYLKEGDTAAKRDGVREWMAGHGYASAPVSIDASDWYYSQRLALWSKAHPGGDATAFRDAYLRHLLDRGRYYDGLARDVLKRSPAHVLLLHANLINATFLPDVIAMFREQGWTIVAAEQAFADPLYRQQPRSLPAGESIVWALAKDAGRTDLRYPAEDDAYEKPLIDALGPDN